MFSKLLIKAKKNKTLLSIYVEPENFNKPAVGYIQMLDDEFVIVKSISSRGEAVGHHIRRISEIFRISSDGKYERKLEILSKKNQLEGSIFNSTELKIKGNKSLLHSTLEFAISHDFLIKLWVDDDEESIIGKVQKVDTDLVHVLYINDLGEKDDLNVVDISTINHLDVNTVNLQLRGFLV